MRKSELEAQVKRLQDADYNRRKELSNALHAGTYVVRGFTDPIDGRFHPPKKEKEVWNWDRILIELGKQISPKSND